MIYLCLIRSIKEDVIMKASCNRLKSESPDKNNSHSLSLWQRNELIELGLRNRLKKIKDFNPESVYEKENRSISEWIREWDFSRSNTKVYTHGIHQYPAMFIPQVIRKLILEFSSKGDTVLDIFNGSGTTMVECIVTGRKSIGIEKNPLAVLLSKVKTTPLSTDILIDSYIKILNIFNSPEAVETQNFSNIDIWFTEQTKIILSRLLYSINSIKNDHFRNSFQICFSDIVRYFSTCKHSGFKMHRDTDKIDVDWTIENILDKFHKSFESLLVGIYQLNKFSENYYQPFIHHGDSKIFHPEIGKNSSDLIITSPPYGDSRTTVAYGQFSRLSSQWLGLIEDKASGIENIDAELLGGSPNGLELNDSVLDKSMTLKSSFNNFLWEIEKCHDLSMRKKLVNRSKDVLSFYKDLDQTIKHGSDYLKENKYFILITGSRIVKNVKLNTDIIISEFAENYGLVLDGILYRKTIPKKRMPSRVSPSNVAGETSPTMTKESIVILRKI